jgi:metal-responsive CopG/Arc/MetJ family transcriptional regulator
MAAGGKVIPVRFTDDELALLDVIQGQTGIRSRNEALRALLEYYAKEKGLRAPPVAEQRGPRK